MEIELQTICVIRPAYFTTAVLLLLAATIASGISVIVAVIRRFRGANIGSPRMKKFHVGVVLVWVMYTAAVGIESMRDRRELRQYEETTGKVAPAVRAALDRQTRTVLTFGAGCAAVGLLSMLAWRGMAQPMPHEHVS